MARHHPHPSTQVHSRDLLSRLRRQPQVGEPLLPALTDSARKEEQAPYLAEHGLVKVRAQVVGPRGLSADYRLGRAAAALRRALFRSDWFMSLPYRTATTRDF